MAKIKLKMMVAMPKETEDKLKQFISTFSEKVQRLVFRGACPCGNWQARQR